MGFDPKADHERLARKLTEMGAVKPCSRCGHEPLRPSGLVQMHRVTRLDDEGEPEPMPDPGGILGPVFATIMCENCGNMSLHAVQFLDLA